MASSRESTPAFRPKLFASICGGPGSGKTAFALTFPDRTDDGEGILVFSVDPNTDASVHITNQERRAAGLPALDVEVRQYILPGITFGGRGSIQDKADEVWSAFLDDVYEMVLKAKHKPASVILDTATQFSHLHLYAEHGKLDEIPQFERGKTNHRFLSFLHTLKQSGCHVGLLHRLRPVYADMEVRSKQGMKKVSERTGEMEREGNSKTDYACDVEVFLYHDETRHDDQDEQFGMRITRSTYRPLLKGKEYWGTNPKTGVRRVSFDRLARLIHPDVEWRR